MEATPRTETSLDFLRSLLRSQSQRVFAAETTELHIRLLSEHIVSVCDALAAVHDALPITEDSPVGDFVLRYEWPLELRDYIVLLRNIGINHIKGRQLKPEQLSSLRSASAKVVEGAATDVLSYVSERVDAVTADPKRLKTQLQDWNSINDPWPALAAQLQELRQQGEHLQTDLLQTDNLRAMVDSLRQKLAAYLDQTAELLSTNDRAIDYAQEAISSHLQVGKIAKIAPLLDQYEEPSINRWSFIQVSAEIEDGLSIASGRYSYPVYLSGYEVIVKDMQAAKTAKTWLEAEVYPLIYEIDDIIRRSDNDRNMAVVNLRNRANVLSKRIADGEEVEIHDQLFGATLDTYSDKKQVNHYDFDKIRSELEDRIEEGTDIHKLYNTQESLFAVSMESSIRYLGLRRNQLLVDAKDWLLEKVGFLGDYISKAESENALSSAEKVTRYIHLLDNPARSNSYANIFLTKGFIGESFVVGRDTEISRIIAAYQAWLDGYRGTVLLSGHRMSGRTLMGELVSNTLFAKKTIRLVPGRSYTIAGRTFECTNDLSASLAEVIKYGARDRLMILLDNIELWHDDKTTLLTNMRSLVKAMDGYGDKLFFVVSSTHWVNNYLHQHLKWKDSYQLNINLDSLSKEDLAKAISIRHGATHKILTNDMGERISPYQFRRQCDKIHRRSEGIIGEALHQWANTIYDDEEGSEKVTQRIGLYYTLPRIVNQTSGPLLKLMLTYRKVNEYQINKLMGASFNDTYKPVIRRYSQMGILGRKVDGRLHVQSLLVNDIARQLHSDQWLNQDF